MDGSRSRLSWTRTGSPSHLGAECSSPMKAGVSAPTPLTVASDENQQPATHFTALGGGEPFGPAIPALPGLCSLR
jgi:hypothetical protein